MAATAVAADDEKPFTPEPTHYKLIFEDPELAGLRVTMCRMSLGEALALDEARLAPSDDPTANIRRVRHVAELVAAKVVSWNLGDQLGQSVPIGVDGLLAQEEPVFNAIVGSYVTAIRGVDAPLDSGSPDGAPYPEGSIPMETLSPNP
jgi:hypothetical protein